MKGCAGCLIVILLVPIILALLICMVSWMFMTDFYIFDIIITFILLGLHIVIPILILIGIIYIILEFFR